MQAPTGTKSMFGAQALSRRKSAPTCEPGHRESPLPRLPAFTRSHVEDSNLLAKSWLAPCRSLVTLWRTDGFGTSVRDQYQKVFMSQAPPLPTAHRSPPANCAPLALSRALLCLL